MESITGSLMLKDRPIAIIKDGIIIESDDKFFHCISNELRT